MREYYLEFQYLLRSWGTGMYIYIYIYIHICACFFLLAIGGALMVVSMWYL